MKRNLVSKKIISILLIALLLVATRVYAANDSFGTTIKASGTQVERGGSITVTIGLKDIAIESGEKGIGAYTANIEFDASVLEYVSTNATANWEAPFYQNGLIVGNTRDGEVVNTTQDIGTITFKVKNDAKLGETNIGLTKFSGSTAESDVSATDSFVKITVLDSNNGNDNPNSGNNNQNTGSNTDSSNTNTNNNSNTNLSTNDTSIKPVKIPQTGENSIFIIAGIGILAISTVIFSIKFKMLNK